MNTKMVTKQNGKDLVVSYRLDKDVVKLFDCYAYSKDVSKKKALETIITEYLDGRGLDEVDQEILERISGIHTADILERAAHKEKGNEIEKVDGRERYEMRGIQAGEIISDVMERVESAEGFGMSQAWDVGNALKYILRAGRKDAIDMELGKAENYLHHAITGEWIGYRDE